MTFHFDTIGENLSIVLDRFINDQVLCKLAYYQSKDALTKANMTQSEREDLVNRNFLIVPKISETKSIEIPINTDIKGSRVLIAYQHFTRNLSNLNFLDAELSIHVLCPQDEWAINGKSPRPFIMMERVQTLLEDQPLESLGVCRLSDVLAYTLTPYFAGFRMRYMTHETS